jgi:hypothetical protein
MYKHLITGKGNFIGKGSDKIAIVNGLNNVVHPGASSIVLLNTSGRTTTPRDNGKTFIDNRVIVSPRSQTLTVSSSSTNPWVIRMDYGISYVDASGGDVYIKFDDPALWPDTVIYFKRIDNSVNLVYFQPYGSELMEFMAMPTSTILLSQGDSVTVTTNGTDWFII